MGDGRISGGFALKPEELVKALRCCAEGECGGCQMYADKQRCQERTLDSAAEQIERDQKEIEALREENERLTRRLFEPHPVPTTSTL